MEKEIDIRILQACIETGQIQWRQHALERLLERGITRLEVTSAIQNGELIEIYSKDKPLPSCLIHSTSDNGKPLHVVMAVDLDVSICHIITVYRPDHAHFENDLKTRRGQK